MVDPNCLYLYIVFLTKQDCIFAWVLGQNYTIINIIIILLSSSSKRMYAIL